MNLAAVLAGGIGGLVLMVVIMFVVWMRYYQLTLKWPPKFVASPTRETTPQRQRRSGARTQTRGRNANNPLNDLTSDDIADVILSCAIRVTEGDKCCICLCGMDEEGLVVVRNDDGDNMSDKDPDEVKPTRPKLTLSGIHTFREPPSSSPYASPINSPREDGDSDTFSIAISSPEDNSPDSEPPVHIEAASFSSAPTTVAADDTFENTHALWIRLPCNHVYHGNCIKHWLETKSAANKTCPMCRSRIVRPFVNGRHSDCRPSNE